MDVKQKWIKAPLPFQGQKRKWYKEFRGAVRAFDNCNVFVDLFGGSGLLSRWVTDVRTDAVVYYNDFDDYVGRLAHIRQTNLLLRDIRGILRGFARWQGG